MKIKPDKEGSPVARISISIQPEMLEQLDRMVSERGDGSRSQAITNMVHQNLIDYKSEVGCEVMAGTITLLYDRSVARLQTRISDLQYQHIAEVISSLHVHLAENKMMEVILVQGTSPQLQAITNAMTTFKGVISARLQLMAAVIPQLHAAKAPPRR